MVGTEDGDGIGEATYERDADGDRLLGRGNTWRGPEGLCGFDKTGAGLIQDGAHESLKSTGREGGLIIYHGVMFKVELDRGAMV